jgi:hypothetical protein
LVSSCIAAPAHAAALHGENRCLLGQHLISEVVQYSCVALVHNWRLEGGSSVGAGEACNRCSPAQLLTLQYSQSLTSCGPMMGEQEHAGFWVGVQQSMVQQLVQGRLGRGSTTLQCALKNRSPVCMCPEVVRGNPGYSTACTEVVTKMAPGALRFAKGTVGNPLWQLLKQRSLSMLPNPCIMSTAHV